MTTSHTTPTEPGWHGQTFLVGKEISLRRLEKRDAQSAMAWRNTRFPVSPSVTESWITESLNNERTGIWVVVRKSDDRIVGGMTLRRGNLAPTLTVHIDPHYTAARQWTAEVYRLAVPWLRDEIHVVSLQLPITAEQTEAIAALEELGCFCGARFREMRRVDGRWVDLLRYVALHPRWLERFGNPAETPIERAGTGLPRPVPSHGTFSGDPPKGAMAIGERIYLKAFDKEDAEALSRLNRVETETFFGHSRLLTTNGNKVHSRLEEPSFRLRDYVPFAIRRRADDTIIGDCGLENVDFINRSAESYSWLFDPSARGEGLGFEAKHLMLGYAFETLGLHSVQSFVQETNLRSAAALRKQGYSEAGRLFWRETTNGGFMNQLVFDLLADEWRSLPRAADTDSTPMPHTPENRS